VVVKRQIASKSTIQKAQHLLRQVVLNGTARRLQSDEYAFAGKTGTSQINYRDAPDQSKLRYRASFVGFFPAEAPKYSVLVLITDPREHGRYGSDVAAPVFRRIADEIFERELAPQQILNDGPPPPVAAAQLPPWQAGWRSDLEYLLSAFQLPVAKQVKGDWAVVRPVSRSDTLQLVTRDLENMEAVPSVVGMGLRDALAVLENRGLSVEVTGYGRVVQQSIIPGTRVNRQNIRIVLD
jgi:cell division protein FtsI (penicillin-binding protein 3)